MPDELTPLQDLGPCLCLSGGGFRATLFHMGVIQRLNELGVLSKLSTITSVSGGSILNGYLAARWSKLTPNAQGVYTNLHEVIVNDVRKFCNKDLRTGILLGTRLKPKNWWRLLKDRLAVAANYLVPSYHKQFQANLGELNEPSATTPRFIFCATNMRTGACWHFHGGPKARMGDFYTGYCDAQQIKIAEAVAASSAFPGAIGALRLTLPRHHPFSRFDAWGNNRPPSDKRGDENVLRAEGDVLLTDGGVYDNLGVEPVWSTFKTLLVSDASRPFHAAENVSQKLTSRLKRVLDISMAQVSSTRRRWLVQDYREKRRNGTLWQIDTSLQRFSAPDRQGYGDKASKLLQQVRTDLDAFTADEIGCLENHGYSIADAAIRSFTNDIFKLNPAPFIWPNTNMCTDAAAETALANSAKKGLLRDLWRYLVG